MPKTTTITSQVDDINKPIVVFTNVYDHETSNDHLF